MMGSSQMLLNRALFATTNIFGSPLDLCFIYWQPNPIHEVKRNPPHSGGLGLNLVKFGKKNVIFEVAVSFKILAHPNI